MHQLTRTSPSQRTGARLLALLLALLLLMVTLSSHGVMESHPSDCGIATEWMTNDGLSADGHSGDNHSADHDASSCAACSATTGQAQLLVVVPEPQTLLPAMVVAPPPR